MPERGDGKGRFHAGVDGRPPHSWEIVDTENQLLVVFHSGLPDLPPQRLDITAWRVTGKLAPVFAQAFARHYVGLERSTRSNHAKVFRDCFCVFMVERGLKIDTPADAPRELLQDFYRWNEQFLGLRVHNASESVKSVATQSPLSTRMDRAKPVKAIFAQLLVHNKNNEWNIEIPKNPFAGKKPGKAKKKEVDLNLYIAFIEIAIRAALMTMQEILPHLKSISRSISNIGNGKKYDPTKIDHVVAKAIIVYDGLIPERKEIQNTDPQLFAEIEAHGYSRVRRIAQPQAAELIPFLYVMAANTGFNQQPLTHLELSQIDTPTLFGVSRMIISPPKRRANSVVRRSFPMTDEPLSVPSIVSFIRSWTANIRKAAPEFAKNDLWLFANKWKSGEQGNQPIRSLAAREKNNQSELANHILRYCKEQKFKFIGLREVRLSFSDLFLIARPGDLQGLRILLGQKSLATPANHYQTERALVDGQELLAGAMGLHERWVGSNGKIDSRAAGEGRERTAATPGFICADAYQSPILGQRVGRLCDAYGRCPECPLAALDGDKPYAVARLLQLEVEYIESKERLGKEIWRKKYQVSFEKLVDSWLPPLVSDADLLDAAANLLLPPLPELE